MSNIKFVQESKIADNVENTATLNSKKLGFDPTAFVHLRDVLTRLYSNAPMAAFRETLANAVDSRQKSGVDRPIEVTLPSEKNNWVLTVQDYGLGMSYNDIDQTYALYGGSTKRVQETRKSNIGKYGLGAKSALAFASRFDVVSIKDGEKISFHMGKVNESDESGDFSITYDAIEKTDEPNGVTVKIPYPPRTNLKTSAVYVSIMRGLSNIVVNGEKYETTLDNEEFYLPLKGLTGETIAYVFNSAKHNYYLSGTTGSRLNISLGGMVYPINLKSVRENLDMDTDEADGYREAFYYLGSNGADKEDFYLNIPMHLISPIPSREDIYYTPETALVIAKYAKEALDVFVNTLFLELNKLETPKEVLAYVKNWHIYLSYKSDELMWRGEKVISSYIPEKTTHGHLEAVRIQRRQARGRNVSWLPYSTRDSIVIAERSKSELVVKLTHPVQSPEAVEMIRKVTRRMRSYSVETGITDILCVPEKVYNNKWWNFSEGYDSDLSTLEEVYEDMLRLARENRVVAPKVEKDKKLSPYKLATPVAEKEKFGCRVSDVLVSDEALTKPILFTTPNEMLVQYPQNGTYYNGRDGLWEFIKDNFAEDYTILALNSRQRVETFKTLFPEARSLRKVFLEELKKQGAAQVTPAWQDIYNRMSWEGRTTIERILEGYVQYAKPEGMENPHFEELLVQRTKLIEHEDKIATLYRSFALGRPEEVEDQIHRMISLVDSLVQKYDFVNYLLKAPDKLAKKNKDFIVLAFRQAGE